MTQIELWRQNARMLAEKLEEYARNYKCNKCSEYYCRHMLAARAKKFKKEIDSMVFGLLKAKGD